MHTEGIKIITFSSLQLSVLSLEQHADGAYDGSPSLFGLLIKVLLSAYC